MEFLIDSAQEAEANEPELSPPEPLWNQFTKQPKQLRLQATRLFLTYPQNNTTKEVAMERLKEMFKDNLKGALIAQEQHKTGW